MKIISISVYGTQDRYIVGAKRQIELARLFLDDWTVRIYTDNPANFLGMPRVEVIEVKDSSFGMFWRFRPMFEHPDNIVLVRDSDSRFTIREVLCINEWLDSTSSLHVIRDHQAHYEWPIIGTLFGYKGQLPSLLANTMAAQQQHHFYTSDQIWLRDHLWPFAKDTSLVHCMQTTPWFRHLRTKLKNPFDFCGNGWTEHDLPIYPPSLEAHWNNVTTDANKFTHGEWQN